MLVKVTVSPKAKVNLIEKLLDGSFKIKTTAPAVNNLANQAVTKMIANYFKIAPSLVTIIRGEKSKHKILEIYEK
jgi:uncharacterized protein (TIGR00251 family)